MEGHLKGAKDAGDTMSVNVAVTAKVHLPPVSRTREIKPKYCVRTFFICDILKKYLFVYSISMVSNCPSCL